MGEVAQAHYAYTVVYADPVYAELQTTKGKLLKARLGLRDYGRRVGFEEATERLANAHTNITFQDDCAMRKLAK